MPLQDRYKGLGAIITIINIILYILIVVFLFVNMVKEQNLIPPPQFVLKMQLLRNSIKERIFSYNYIPNLTCRDYLGYFFMIRIGCIIDYENNNKTPYMISLSSILIDYSISTQDKEDSTIKMKSKATNSRTLNYFHESKPCLLNYILEINLIYNGNKHEDKPYATTNELHGKSVEAIYEKALQNKETSLVRLNYEVMRIWGYEIEARVYFRSFHRIKTRSSAKLLREKVSKRNGEKAMYKNQYQIDVFSHEFDRNAKICRIKNGLYLLFYPNNKRSLELNDSDFYIPDKITVLEPTFTYISVSLFTGALNTKPTLEKIIQNLDKIEGQKKIYIFLMYSKYKFDVRDGKLHILLETKVLKVLKAFKYKKKNINTETEKTEYNYTMMIYYPLIRNMISGIPITVK